MNAYDYLKPEALPRRRLRRSIGNVRSPGDCPVQAVAFRRGAITISIDAGVGTAAARSDLYIFVHDLSQPKQLITLFDGLCRHLDAHLRTLRKLPSLRDLLTKRWPESPV